MVGKYVQDKSRSSSFHVFTFWIQGSGYDNCRKLVNEKFAKVFYKNNYAQGTTIQSLYMTYGMFKVVIRTVLDKH